VSKHNITVKQLIDLQNKIIAVGTTMIKKKVNVNSPLLILKIPHSKVKVCVEVTCVEASVFGYCSSDTDEEVCVLK
jgi:hypothetical protein